MHPRQSERNSSSACGGSWRSPPSQRLSQRLVVHGISLVLSRARHTEIVSKPVYTQSAADPPTHSRLRLWSTPIMMPRPMRSSGNTGVISPPSGQTYIMRISAWVMPCGVSITGSKRIRSCRM